MLQAIAEHTTSAPVQHRAFDPAREAHALQYNVSEGIEALLVLCHTPAEVEILLRAMIDVERVVRCIKRRHSN